MKDEGGEGFAYAVRRETNSPCLLAGDGVAACRCTIGRRRLAKSRRGRRRAHVRIVIVERDDQALVGGVLPQDVRQLCEVGRLDADADGIGETDLVKRRNPRQRSVEHWNVERMADSAPVGIHLLGRGLPEGESAVRHLESDQLTDQGRHARVVERFGIGEVGRAPRAGRDIHMGERRLEFLGDGAAYDRQLVRKPGQDKNVAKRDHGGLELRGAHPFERAVGNAGVERLLRKSAVDVLLAHPSDPLAHEPVLVLGGSLLLDLASR
jgi:hypothetical protein